MNREQALFLIKEHKWSSDSDWFNAVAIITKIVDDFEFNIDTLLRDIENTQDKDLIVSKIKALKDNQ